MRTLSVRLAAVTAAALVVLGPAAVRADDKSEIKALYTKLAKALKAKDVKGVIATGTSDFVHKGAGMPEMDAKATAKMMEQQFKMMKSVDQVEMKPDKITVKGKTAVVMSSYTMKGKMDMGDGKVHSMSDKGTSKETLAKTAKGWRFKSVEMLTQNPTMDGKPMAMEAAAPAKK